MFGILTRAMRRRVGRVLVLAYVACVMVPPLALAFADGVMAHCIIGERQAVAAVPPAPVHEHGTAHAHHHGDHGAPAEHNHSASHDQGTTGSHDKTMPADCCGWMCLNATAVALVAPDAPCPRVEILTLTLDAAPVGLGPFRIDRPPNALGSL
jgi:hypothetical protein